jgi:hypothetical protein
VLKRFGRHGAFLLFAAMTARAQSVEATRAIIERLDRLEAENKRMAEEIAGLKGELAAARGTPDAKPDSLTDQRVQVQESRTAELDQKKVESSQKMPVQLTGMLLFNAYANGKYSGTVFSDPVAAAATPGSRTSGATLRQTVLGLRFFGPDLPGNGKVSGSVYMDFFSGNLEPNDNILHVRLATLDLKWKHTTVTVGQDKPIVAPREPTSLAQVGVSPLTGAGNLWQWQPQAKVEQRFTLSERSEFRIQAGVIESYEGANTVPAPYTATLALWRPAYEARAEYSFTAGSMRFEIAPGYHHGASRVASQSVDSRAITLDGLARLSSRLEFTGAWFTGKNLAGLGTLRQGFTILASGSAVPVHIDGGWGQATLTATPRWSFHLYAGEEYDRARDLAGNGVSRNIVYGGNTMWKLAPNVVAALEISQARTSYLISGFRLNNHYDLALAYLF